MRHFRVLSPVVEVELRGTAERLNPATGHIEEIVAPKLDVTRSQLEMLNLDDVDPDACLKGLGGEFKKNRKGELQPVAGEV